MDPSNLIPCPLGTYVSVMLHICMSCSTICPFYSNDWSFCRSLCPDTYSYLKAFPETVSVPPWLKKLHRKPLNGNDSFPTILDKLDGGTSNVPPDPDFLFAQKLLAASYHQPIIPETHGGTQPVAIGTPGIQEPGQLTRSGYSSYLNLGRFKRRDIKLVSFLALEMSQFSKDSESPAWTMLVTRLAEFLSSPRLPLALHKNRVVGSNCTKRRNTTVVLPSEPGRAVSSNDSLRNLFVSVTKIGNSKTDDGEKMATTAHTRTPLGQTISTPSSKIAHHKCVCSLKLLRKDHVFQRQKRASFIKTTTNLPHNEGNMIITTLSPPELGPLRNVTAKIEQSFDTKLDSHRDLVERTADDQVEDWTAMDHSNVRQNVILGDESDTVGHSKNPAHAVDRVDIDLATLASSSDVGLDDDGHRMTFDNSTDVNCEEETTKLIADDIKNKTTDVSIVKDKDVIADNTIKDAVNKTITDVSIIATDISKSPGINIAEYLNEKDTDAKLTADETYLETNVDIGDIKSKAKINANANDIYKTPNVDHFSGDISNIINDVNFTADNIKKEDTDVNHTADDIDNKAVAVRSIENKPTHVKMISHDINNKTDTVDNITAENNPSNVPVTTDKNTNDRIRKTWTRNRKGRPTNKPVHRNMIPDTTTECPTFPQVQEINGTGNISNSTEAVHPVWFYIKWCMCGFGALIVVSVIGICVRICCLPLNTCSFLLSRKICNHFLPSPHLPLTMESSIRPATNPSPTVPSSLYRPRIIASQLSNFYTQTVACFMCLVGAQRPDGPLDDQAPLRENGHDRAYDEEDLGPHRVPTNITLERDPDTINQQEQHNPERLLSHPIPASPDDSEVSSVLEIPGSPTDTRGGAVGRHLWHGEENLVSFQPHDPLSTYKLVSGASSYTNAPFSTDYLPPNPPAVPSENISNQC